MANSININFNLAIISFNGSFIMVVVIIIIQAVNYIVITTAINKGFEKLNFIHILLNWVNFIYLINFCLSFIKTLNIPVIIVILHLGYILYKIHYNFSNIILIHFIMVVINIIRVVTAVIIVGTNNFIERANMVVAINFDNYFRVTEVVFISSYFLSFVTDINFIEANTINMKVKFFIEMILFICQ